MTVCVCDLLLQRFAEHAGVCAAKVFVAVGPVCDGWVREKGRDIEDAARTRQRERRRGDGE